MLHKLLVVEDETNLRRIINEYFTHRNFDVDEARDGVEALERISKKQYDIIILDIMMPRLDGMSVCHEIRRKYDVPIIFLTAVYDDESKLASYAAGADDYVTKPFSLSLLQAKAQVLIRRYKGDLVTNGLIRLGGLEIEPARHAVRAGGKSIAMAPKEYDLLLYLVENKNQVLSRAQILDRVWGEDYWGYDRAVDTHIKKLRAALGDYGNAIVTIVKAGYSWKVPSDE